MDKAEREPHEIANQLYTDLTSLDREAFSEQAIEAALTPYVERLQVYQQVAKQGAARRLCMGLLLGLYRFDMETMAESELLPPDAVKVIAEEMVFVWKARADRADMVAVMDFIKVEIGEWGSRLV